MTTCRSCRHSFSVHDYELYPVLMCWPGGDRRKEQIAPKEACELYQREAGADEVES